MKGLVVIAAVLCCALLLTNATDKPDKGLPIATIDPFYCEPYEYLPNEPTPTNVHQLRVHDIKAVIAIGDSMTAAFGAGAPEILTSGGPLVPREYRFLSYSAGGGAMRYSLYNLVKVFNPHVQGGATGYTLPTDDVSFGPNGTHIEPVLRENYGLNVALSGAVVQTIPQMVNMAVKQLKTLYNNTVDFENDWKLVTMLLGANNMCGACHNDSGSSVQAYQEALNDGIQYLYENIPRVKLLLLPMFNISQVYYWHETDEYCRFMWETISASECSCITNPKATEQDRKAVNDAAIGYRQALDQVANEWEQKNLTNFDVSVQPFTENVYILNDDLTSSFDCFHPSNLTHAALGAMLWNSMLLPPGQKPVNVTKLLVEGLSWICPDKNSYIY